jgi:hypothetical protein
MKNDTQTPVDITKLSLYQLCRWSALEEAVNIIGEKCDERNIDFERVELKPLEILKYVDNATDLIYQKVLAVENEQVK